MSDVRRFRFPVLFFCRPLLPRSEAHVAHVAWGMCMAGMWLGCGMWDVGCGQCRGLSCAVVQQGSFLIEIHALSIDAAASC
jgi:hypothetical protein